MAIKNEQIPPYPCDICKKAIYQKECGKSKMCPEWRAWFAAEWNNIRKAAEMERRR